MELEQRMCFFGKESTSVAGVSFEKYKQEAESVQQYHQLSWFNRISTC